MPCKIQNNEYSTELEHDNQGTPSLTKIDTVTGLKKLLIVCCLPLTIISLIKGDL